MLVDSKFENELFDGMKNFERCNRVEPCIKEKAKKEKMKEIIKDKLKKLADDVGKAQTEKNL